MKNTLIILMLTVGVVECSAQLYVPNGTVATTNNSATGNVGIGINNPSANLQIGSGTGNGLVNLGGYTGLGSLRSSGDLFVGTNVYALYTSSTENSLMRVLNSTSNGFSAMHFNSDGDVNFFVKNGSVIANDPISTVGATYNAMRIAGNGKVGIGTIAPGAQLTVALPGYSGTPANSSLVYFDQSTNPSDADLKPALELYNGGSSGYGLVSLSANNYVNGRVGIGIASPSEKLDVSGNIQIGISNLLGVAPSTDVFSHDGNFIGNYSLGWAHDSWSTSSGPTGYLSGYAGLKFFSNSTLQMAIDKSGNVGIGTAANSIDAKLAVKGQVHAQEVKVDLNGAVAPDYVFEKDYQLTSLEEIKDYIDQNKHLPEVPSAKEMEKNGVQLGEMNMLLLKKIEELTLYVIEQNRKLASQNEVILKQNDRLNKLETLIQK